MTDNINQDDDDNNSRQALISKAQDNSYEASYNSNVILGKTEQNPIDISTTIDIQQDEISVELSDDDNLESTLISFLVYLVDCYTTLNIKKNFYIFIFIP